MEFSFKEALPIKKCNRPDGTVVIIMPLARRRHLIALLIGFVALPMSVAAPLMLESFSIVFSTSFLAGTCLFFSIWIWATGTYFFSADKFGLEVDKFGIREVLLLRNYFWKWNEIESVEIQRFDGAEVIVLLLKNKTWLRKVKLFPFDYFLSNQYAVSTQEIFELLLEHQKRTAKD